MCSWFIHEPIGGALTKSSREIMEILEAFDLTRCAWSAAELAGCDAKTVARYVRVRDRGGDPFAAARRARLIDPFLDKVEELVEASQGRVRADVVHERLVAMGFSGDERSTRRAVAQVKQAWREGHRRRYRPWVPSRASGFNSTGVRVRGSVAGPRISSAPGWRGHGSGW